MRTATTSAASLGALRRLDAWYYLAPGAAASRRLERAKAAGLRTRRIGGKDGLGAAWQPSRFKRAYAVRGETSIPYLAPHDAFQYLPDDTERLSLTRTANLHRYRIRRGQILQTCSGRNLGPNVLVDDHLAQFATSHDLIRIEIEDVRLRHFSVAFLRSETGQGLLRRDKSGSVIDHITVSHVEAQEIPMLEDELVDRVSDLIGQSFELTEMARHTLHESLQKYESSIPAPTRSVPARDGWTVRAGDLRGRLDAAPYDPWIAEIRRELLKAGGKPVGEVCDVRKPPGRYKTVYVDADHGRPFMSGTQILQLVPAKHQFMAERAFRDVGLYELRSGWSVFMADGRAEKDLGVVAMVPPDRGGWLASGHVGRLVPHADTDPGWLWLAARTWQAQAQIKALASGSVVDSTYPADMAAVILPPDTGVNGSGVASAWAAFSEARAAEKAAIALVDEALAMLASEEEANESAAPGSPGSV